MAQQVISTTISGDGNAVDLDNDNDDLLLTSTGVLESAQGDGVKANASDHDVIIEGHVTANFSAIALGSVGDSNARNTLLVEEAGELRGGIYGVVAVGTLSTVENLGLIESDDVGVAFLTSGTGASSLINSGTIRAPSSVEISGSETFTFTNSGILDSGSDYAFWGDSATGNITIVNTGEIIGHIALGDGDDVYDGSSGILTNGLIFGGAGNDMLKGGADNDFLVGDLGEDVLTGGEGADRFLFDGNAESSPKKKLMDRITDFSRLDSDIIDLHDIDAKKGGTDDDDFKFIKDDEFHGKKGELRYEIGNGKTYIQADYNGDGDADFAIRLTGEFELKKGDFEL